MYQSRITLKQCRKPKSSFPTALCLANGSTMHGYKDFCINTLLLKRKNNVA